MSSSALIDGPRWKRARPGWRLVRFERRAHHRRHRVPRVARAEPRGRSPRGIAVAGLRCGSPEPHLGRDDGCGRRRWHGRGHTRRGRRRFDHGRSRLASRWRAPRLEVRWTAGVAVRRPRAALDAAPGKLSKGSRWQQPPQIAAVMRVPVGVVAHRHRRAARRHGPPRARSGLGARAEAPAAREL